MTAERATKSKKDLVAKTDCVHGGEHYPDRLDVDNAGAERAAVDWSTHQIRPGGTCRVCHHQTFMSDCAGRACHKTCAEADLLGEAGTR